MKARRGSQLSLEGFGTALAGRGDDINEAIVDLRPLLIYLQPVAKNLADPDTQLARFFQALGDAAAEVAPVAETQASLFVNLDTTFTALASVARPFIQESISNSPPAEDAGIRGFPQQRPFLRNSAALVPRAEARRATCCRRRRPILADALEIGTRHARAHAGVQRAARGRVPSRSRTSPSDPLVEPGIERLNDTVESLRPDARLHHARPDGLQLRDALVPQHLEPAVGGRPERHLAAVHHRRDAAGPEQRGRPVERARQRGPTTANFLHANPYPNTAAPGQTAECEAGNEVFHVGQQVIGNVPGNQGTETDGQVEGRADAARRPDASWSPFRVGAIFLVVLGILVYLGFSKDIPFVNPPYELKAVFDERAEHVHALAGADRRRRGRPGDEGRGVLATTPS